MYLSEKIDRIINMMKDSGDFDEVSVIKAYPYSRKPTELDKIVIAISPSNINLKPAGIGTRVLCGQYDIDFDIFIPQRLGSPIINDTTERVIECISTLLPDSVRVSPIERRDPISCYNIKCSATFTKLTEYGGNDNGQL